MTLHIVPAYGRDYRSKAEVIASWASGADFRICDMGCPDNGRYVNNSDYPKGQLQIRYANMRKVCVIDATAKPPVPKAPIEVALAGDVPEPARKRGELRPGDRVKVKPRLASYGASSKGPWVVRSVGKSFVEVEYPGDCGGVRSMARGGLVRVTS